MASSLPGGGGELARRVAGVVVPDFPSSPWSSPVGMRAAWLKRSPFTLVAVGLVLFLGLFWKGGFEGTAKTYKHLQNPRMTRSFADLEANISSICEFEGWSS